MKSTATSLKKKRSGIAIEEEDADLKLLKERFKQRNNELIRSNVNYATRIRRLEDDNDVMERKVPFF